MSDESQPTNKTNSLETNLRKAYLRAITEIKSGTYVSNLEKGRIRKKGITDFYNDKYRKKYEIDFFPERQACCQIILDAFFRSEYFREAINKARDPNNYEVPIEFHENRLNVTFSYLFDMLYIAFKKFIEKCKDSENTILKRSYDILDQQRYNLTFFPEDSVYLFILRGLNTAKDITLMILNSITLSLKSIDEEEKYQFREQIENSIRQTLLTNGTLLASYPLKSHSQSVKIASLRKPAVDRDQLKLVGNLKTGKPLILEPQAKNALRELKVKSTNILMCPVVTNTLGVAAMKIFMDSIAEYYINLQFTKK